MEFRVFRNPDRNADADDRAPVFGKRVSLEPRATPVSARKTVEVAALAIGVATLVYLVVDVL